MVSVIFRKLRLLYGIPLTINLTTKRFLLELKCLQMVAHGLITELLGQLLLNWCVKATCDISIQKPAMKVLIKVL
ncbi:MAG: hypothetical protein CL581_16030 [Alteromonadaceae bacterium]|nr:hypothetical protein [Alteromonadaceae bacterium]MBH87339.1 hypothetical protein [Alteromonadaceae bacterium]